GSGNEGIEALGVGRCAVRKRLERLAGQLHKRLGQLGALGDRTVERSAGEVALKLQIFGRALGLRERTDRVSGLLEAVALLGNDVLANRARTLGGDAAGLDNRLDIGAGEIGELLGNLLAGR